MTSAYFDVIARKRSWTPVAVDKGEFLAGSEETLFRALALRCLELPVKDFLQQGLEKDLPDKPGVVEALLSTRQMRTAGLSYIVAAHGVDPKAESEALRIRDAWLSDESHRP